MNFEQMAWNVAEHRLQLISRHRGMGTEGRHHRLQSVAVVLKRIASQLSGTRISARQIGWDRKHTTALTYVRKRFKQQFVRFCGREFEICTALGEVNTHCQHSIACSKNARSPT